MLGLVFRSLFLCLFSSLLNLGRIGFVTMIIFIFLQCTCFSLLTNFAPCVMSCVFSFVYGMLRYLW